MGVAWYREAERGKLALGYYRALRKAITRNPRLRGVLYRCVDCHIFFLTYWSNPKTAGRRGFRCPMGCRARHGRKESSKRATRYYQTAEGKLKKHEINGRRTGGQGNGQAVPAGCANVPTAPSDLPMIRYLKFILEQVDRCCVSEEEVRRFFSEICGLLRQHSLSDWWKLWHIRDG